MTAQPGDDAAELYTRARSFERAALARLISHIEREDEVCLALTDILQPPAEPAHVIGITGAPGAGKSTLMNKLALELANDEHHVAVLVIDPSSPFSGGAILGDRLRLENLTDNDSIYVRSMANRGRVGGLAAATPKVVDLLECAGWDQILVETVGVGQSEFDIAQLADTLILVVNPGWGDVIQANKAGLMETADIFVINKADRDGLMETRLDLEQLVNAGPETPWHTPIYDTVATRGTGVDDLAKAVREHLAHVTRTRSAADRRRQRLDRSLALELQSHLGAALDRWQAAPGYQQLLDDVLAGATTRNEVVRHFFTMLADR
jgi:LAO/AO transport system kinase